MPDSTAFHGATLSSFTSLTLHPQPLVAFSLRLPSRLADYLRPSSTPSPSDSSSASAPSELSLAPLVTPDPLATLPVPHLGKPLAISLLATAHADIAAKLSQPGQDHSSIFNSAPFALDSQAQGSHGAETDAGALPILPDSIGTMRCEVVSSTLLRDVWPSGPIDEDSIPFDEEVEGAGLRAQPEKQPFGGTNGTQPSPSTPVHGSELFICRVLDVQHGTGAETPMVYYKHEYTTVKE